MNTRLCSASSFAPTWRRWVLSLVDVRCWKLPTSGRSANVRASFGPVHSFSLCYVQLYQVASLSAAGRYISYCLNTGVWVLPIPRNWWWLVNLVGVGVGPQIINNFPSLSTTAPSLKLMFKVSLCLLQVDVKTPLPLLSPLPNVKMFYLPSKVFTHILNHQNRQGVN